MIEAAAVDSRNAHRPTWALAVAMCLLPFATNLPIDFDRTAPLLFAPALLLVLRMGSTANIAANRVDEALLFAAGAVAVCSALLGPHPVPALVQSAAYVWVLAGATVARRAAHQVTAAVSVLAGITLGAAAGCVGVWWGWQEGTPVNEFPHYGHGRLFGLHMMIGTMTGSAWWTFSNALFARRLAAAAAVLCCSGMLWSGGRAPAVGLVAGIAMWLAFSAGHRKKLLRRMAVVLVGGLLLSCLRWSPEPYLGWWNAIARSTAARTADELASTRLSFWSVAWDRFTDAPWIGSGADSYRFIQPKQDGSQPHNWLLQFLLDLGVIGAAPVVVLIFLQIKRGLVRNTPEKSEHRAVRKAAAAGFIACFVAGLLDGVFYHAVLLMPAVLLGAIAGTAPPEASRQSPPLVRLGIAAGLTLSTGILLIHATLVLRLWTAPPPNSPDALPACVLRSFPSTTSGLERWLNKWQSTFPNESLAWARWAQHHSHNPEPLHVYAAHLLWRHGEFTAAQEEIDRALLTAHIRARPRLLKLKEAIRQAENTVPAPAH